MAEMAWLMRYVIPDADAGGRSVFWTRDDELAVMVEHVRVLRDGAFLILAEMKANIAAYQRRWGG